MKLIIEMNLSPRRIAELVNAGSAATHWSLRCSKWRQSENKAHC